MKKNRRQRVIRLLATIASFALAWWLFDIAGYWSQGHSTSQASCFALSFFGIERIVSATVDFLVIALEPRNGQAPRAT